MEHYRVEEHRYVQQTPACAALLQMDLDLEELLQQAKIDDAVLTPDTMQAVADDIKAIVTDIRDETIEIDTMFAMQRIMNSFEALTNLYVKKIEKSNLTIQSYINDNSLF